MAWETPKGRTHRFVHPATAAAAFALSAGIFGFYFGVYRARRFAMPVGFDTSWYVWRARFVGDQGLGPLRTAVRPGHALLSSTLGSMTGVDQLRLAVLLPLVMAGVFALAMGALACAGLGARRVRWAGTVALAGTILGTTRLVGENVATLLLLALVVAALAVLVRWVSGAGGMWGAMALLIAAGLAHWMFLAVVGAMLAVAAASSLPATQRQRMAGMRFSRTDSGAIAIAAGSAGALLVAIIAGVLRAPFSSFEIKEDPARFIPKLRTDLARLLLPLTAPVATLGAVALVAGDGGIARQRRFTIRLLGAWTIVAASGAIYGAITLDLPPHRFLELLVAVPGAVSLAAAVRWLASLAARSTRRRLAPRAAVTLVSALVTAAAVSALSVPGALAWYRHGPGVWLDPVALQQTEVAARYAEALPASTPVVFVVGPLGPAGLVSVPLKERTIRAGFPSDRQVDLHIFVGEPADALAGRRTYVSPPIDRETQPYWDDVKALLGARPPMIVLKSMGPKQFDAAVGLGAAVVAPGVALIQGTEPPEPLAEPPPPRPVPRTAYGLIWGSVLLLLMGAAGAGWSRAMVGRTAPPEVLWSIAPAVGAAALMLGALVAAKLGVRLAGVGGVATYAVVAIGGGVVALFAKHSDSGVARPR